MKIQNVYKRALIILTLALCTGMLHVVGSAQVPAKEKVIAGAERAFEKTSKAVTMPAPGCAVGVSLDGKSVFEKAFGMAEMEHSIPNTPETIFESGSVAKQFAAASIVLLSLEGKLGIDDQVRKYIPELHDYGAPMTIRHLMNHTSGLRDWGSVMALTGVGRGDRVVSQDLAFDIIVHQKGIDFTPGAEYSYSNSGYTLLSAVVERVSKQTLPAFTEERFFKSLGMTHSSWRDDYQRLVPGRAQAYARKGNEWKLEMPFMNVYGNGGMLTTVGDWLKWNAMFDSRSMGTPFVDAMETTGVLNDGRKITYALGLTVNRYKGLREVSHSGSTAGYQAFLARYPDQKLSVAVLCNGTSPSSGAIARSVVDEIAGPFPVPTPPEKFDVKGEELQKYVGLWRSERTHFSDRTTLENGVLKLGGTPLRPQRDGSFLLGGSIVRFTLDKNGKLVSAESNNNGDISRLAAEFEWTPTQAELSSFAGEWYSEEANASFKFVVEGDKAFLVQRPTSRLPLRPQYKDHFTVEGPGSVIWFTKDGKGKVTNLHMGTSRMRDMPFVRVGK